jgi:hypothetical protein
LETVQNILSGYLDPNDLESNAEISYLKYDDTMSKMSFDIWIPRYNIAIEYQGEHHYIPNSMFGTIDFLDRLSKGSYY